MKNRNESRRSISPAIERCAGTAEQTKRWSRAGNTNVAQNPAIARTVMIFCEVSFSAEPKIHAALEKLRIIEEERDFECLRRYYKNGEEDPSPAIVERSCGRKQTCQQNGSGHYVVYDSPDVKTVCRRVWPPRTAPRGVQVPLSPRRRDRCGAQAAAAARRSANMRKFGDSRAGVDAAQPILRAVTLSLHHGQTSRARL